MQKKIECPAYLFYETNDDGSKKENGIIGINPIYSTKEAACADVAIPNDVAITGHTALKIDLWVGFMIPKGHKIVMYPRSSLLFKHGLMQPVSIIDSDYSMQHVHVPVYNLTNSTVFLKAGTRIAQIECVPAYDCATWQHSDKVRGEGGFGSTGI